MVVIEQLEVKTFIKNNNNICNYRYHLFQIKQQNILGLQQQVNMEIPAQTKIQQAHNHFTHYSHYIGQHTITGNQLLDQFLQSWVMTLIFACIFYMFVSLLSYLILFKFCKKKFTPFQSQLTLHKVQIWYDIKWSFINIIGQSPLVTLIKLSYPYFSKVQYVYQWKPILIFYLIFHLFYDQFLTYWAHRILHHPFFYTRFHYIHHKSKSVTPFSGFAFHPLDAFAQAVPVLTSCFFVPLPIDIVILHGLITSIWAISIHDNVNMIPFKGILYAGSHSIHHFPWGQNYNYGKITSVCDRLYGSYCDPEGITGYGYKPSNIMQNLCNNMNNIYTKIIPDHGKQRIQKQSRQYAQKQHQLLLQQLQQKQS